MLLQLVGVHFLFNEKQGRAADKRLVASLPADVVITDHPYIPSLMTGVAEKDLLYIIDQESLNLLLAALHAHNIRRFAFLETMGYPIAVPARLDGVEIREEGKYTYRFEEHSVTREDGSIAAKNEE